MLSFRASQAPPPGTSPAKLASEDGNEDPDLKVGFRAALQSQLGRKTTSSEWPSAKRPFQDVFRERR